MHPIDSSPILRKLQENSDDAFSPFLKKHFVLYIIAFTVHISNAKWIIFKFPVIYQKFSASQSINIQFKLQYYFKHMQLIGKELQSVNLSRNFKIFIQWRVNNDDAFFTIETK